MVVSEEGFHLSECNKVAGAPVSRLPRVVLLLSGNTSPVSPHRVLCDSGASHCVMSPRAARGLGYYVPDEPEGEHGTMKVADGSTAPIYGWTKAVRVHPPTHLPASDGSGRITSLPPMHFLVADISEDVIMGFDYIQPLDGGFAKTVSGNCFRLANSSKMGAPTVNIPVVGQTEASSITHHTLDRGPQGPAIETTVI